MNIKVNVVLGILIPSIAIILYLLGSTWVKGIEINFVENERINHLIKFQFYGIVLSLVVLVITLLYAPESKKYLRFGDLSSLSHPVRILGIKTNDNWYKTGLSFLVGITSVTALFMYLGMGKEIQWNNLVSLTPYILLFSLTNSFSEEIIVLL